jgi:hypothetical protein
MTTFSGTIEHSDAPGGWWYVKLPPEVKRELQPLFTGGSAKVKATVGKTTWPVTIMPMGGGVWMMPLKAEVRVAESLQTGQEILVTIAPR